MSAESNERPLPPSPLEAGLEHLSAGRMSDALHSLHEAYYISPTDPRLHEALGAIYLGMGQPERAAAYVRYAKYLAPTSPGVLYQEALLHLHRGQSKVAEALLRRIVELAPDFAPARQALEAELARRQIAAELPAVQPADRPWIELEVVPQKYTGTDARDRLLAPRAPHHCANCFYRPGQHPRPQSAVEYRWLNLGLIAALFIAWVAYVLWTLASRRHVLKFVPLYCAVCDQHYRRWQGVQAAGLVWTAVFALCTLCTLPLVVTSDSLASTVAFGALLLTVMGGIIVAVHAAGPGHAGHNED